VYSCQVRTLNNQRACFPPKQPPTLPPLPTNFADVRRSGTGTITQSYVWLRKEICRLTGRVRAKFKFES